jgi:branched-chain amino acid transport system ATP-binding protein
LASELALEVQSVSVRRGALRVVHDVSFSVRQGSIVGLLGLNGAGKSSLLASLAGDLPQETGTVTMLGTDVTPMRAWDRSKSGLVLVPAGRQLFSAMTVTDNLLVGGHLRSAKERAESMETIFSLFPILRDKRRQGAGELSGGQQQMLAVGRGLMADPKVLMLDEPSEGLAPIVVEQMFEVIRQLRDETGLTIVLAEQNSGVVDMLDEAFLVAAGHLTPVATGDETSGARIQEYLFGN